MGAVALENLGFDLGRSTIQRILTEHGIEPAPLRGRTMPWKTFLRAHLGATKPRIAPRWILARHRQQLLDLVTSGGWTAETAAGPAPVVLRSDLLTVPPKDGLRRRQRRHLGQMLSAERLSFLGEQPSLGIGEAKTLGPEPGPEHAVLGAQVLDRFALPATDPASDQRNEELKGHHGRPGSADNNPPPSHPVGRNRVRSSLVHYAIAETAPPSGLRQSSRVGPRGVRKGIAAVPVTGESPPRIE